jgi:endogenous inhibitor of DNA gyrase (YacG/DUF329 family)
LDRSQALNLLREIAQKCPLIDEKTVSLNESNPYDLASKGCQIIVGGINKDDKTCIRKAIAHYDYLIKELADRMVIYDPAQLKCPECGRSFGSTKELKTHITTSHYSQEHEQTEMPTGRM